MAERWILAALRNHTFFKMAELNQAISQKLEALNNRRFQKINSSRRNLFETIDRPALKPLPERRYEYAEWRKPRVNIDYHIELDPHCYSVPYQFRREQVDVRRTATTVEVLFKNQRIASHHRSYREGRFTTLTEHMPKSHRRYLEWTPSRIIRWAGKNGPKTQKLITQIMDSRPHPEQGFRSCLGIMRLAQWYSRERVEKARARALAINGLSYKSVESILKNGLDQQPLICDHPEKPNPLIHDNIRGIHYYH